jgi:hypothetical protein
MLVKPFDHYLAQVGYHDTVATPPPSKHVVYGYRAGELVFTGDTKAAAYAAGALVVETAKNPEYVQHQLTKQNLHTAAYNLWLADLYAEEPDLPNPVLARVFTRAWDDDHSSGYDAVAVKFSDECEYIRECLQAATQHAQPGKYQPNRNVQPPPYQTVTEGYDPREHGMRGFTLG